MRRFSQGHVPSFESGLRSLQELVDKGLPEAVLAPVRDTIMGVDGVLVC